MKASFINTKTLMLGGESMNPSFIKIKTNVGWGI